VSAARRSSANGSSIAEKTAASSSNDAGGRSGARTSAARVSTMSITEFTMGTGSGSAGRRPGRAVWCRDLGALYAFVTGLDMPSAEVTVVARAVKRGGRPGSQ
jgi:hypothetical protein